MTSVPDKDITRIGPFPKGANNVAREDSMPAGAARSGTNVDWYADGKWRRRFGTTPQSTLAGVQNMWSDGHYGLCTAGTGLYRFIPGSGFLQLFDGIEYDADVCYASVNQYIRVSDGLIALRVNTADNSIAPWGVATPLRNPIATAVANGGFDAGAYQFCVTQARADGEESGALPSDSVDVPDGGGIVLTSFPPTPSDVNSFVIYLTEANGTEECVHTVVPSNVSSVELYKVALGRPLLNQLLVPMPPGTSQVATLGMLFVAVGPYLIRSMPWQYGLTDQENNYIQMPDDIVMISATAPMAKSTGLFVATKTSTYFVSVAGPNPGDFEPLLVYGYGAVPNSNTMVPGGYFEDGSITTSLVPVWVASNGALCYGMSDGSVRSKTDGKFMMATGDRGSLISRELNSIRQMLVSMRPPKMHSRVVAQDSLTIGRYKNGTKVA